MKKEKILIVDDEAKMRELARIFLEDEGFVVLEAGDGMEALEKCKENKPELVLLDIKMPGMDGVQALKIIKKNYPETEVVMVTAVGELETALSCIREGAFGYQLKPVNFEVMLMEAARALEHRRLVLENKEYLAGLEKKVEEKTRELTLKNRELEKMDELKSKFIDCISHELRTPLTQIIGCISVLKMYLQERNIELEENLLRIIQGGTDRLNRVIADMVKVLQAEFKEGLLNKNRVLVNELVQMICSRASFFAKIRKQQLEYLLPERKIYFEADEGKFTDILVNLCMNAIKFTPNGGKIFVLLEDAGNSFRVTVKDSGIGISADEKLHIFKKFYEAGDSLTHSTGTYQFKSGGLGLGLSIAKLFTEMHGGEIQVKSPGKDQGSAFTVEFPLKK